MSRLLAATVSIAHSSELYADRTGRHRRRGLWNQSITTSSNQDQDVRVSGRWCWTPDTAECHMIEVSDFRTTRLPLEVVKTGSPGLIPQGR